MDMRKELDAQADRENLVVARLAVAYTLLALAPYNGWGHEGTPAEMAAYVVKVAKDRGNFGFVSDIIGNRAHNRWE